MSKPTKKKHPNSETSKQPQERHFVESVFDRRYCALKPLPVTIDPTNISPEQLAEFKARWKPLSRLLVTERYPN
jgi:hypothetical protein